MQEKWRHDIQYKKIHRVQSQRFYIFETRAQRIPRFIIPKNHAKTTCKIEIHHSNEKSRERNQLRRRINDFSLFFFFFPASIRAKYELAWMLEEANSPLQSNSLINHSLSPIWLTFLLLRRDILHPLQYIYIYASAWLDVEIHRGQLTIPNCPPLSARHRSNYLKTANATARNAVESVSEEDITVEKVFR